jgi:hypothetical protein
MRKILYSMLKDGDDDTISSKRVVTFSAFVLCAVAFVSNLFWGFEVKQFMYESMIYLAMAGLSVTVAERFAPKKKKDIL